MIPILSGWWDPVHSHNFCLCPGSSLRRKGGMSKHDSTSKASMTRRHFIYYSTLAAAGAATLRVSARPAPRKLGSADKLRIACVGTEGKGASDIQHCGHEEIVALCDVDESRAVKARKDFPNAKFYFDWREMLEKE